MAAPVLQHLLQQDLQKELLGGGGGLGFRDDSGLGFRGEGPSEGALGGGDSFFRGLGFRV